jgi:hypothetical protein
MIGSTITIYRKTGGVWSSVKTCTDSTYSSAGKIGLETQGTTARLDNFGGGTVVSNSAPAAPTLSSPSNAATNTSLTPTFQLRTTDADNDYLRYEIQVCSTSNCSSVVRTVCQDSNLPNSCTGSQTGWSGQDQQTSTAYTGNSTISSSTMATYTYQAAALSGATQYWWRAYAIDPGGSNTTSSVSSIFSFTTSAVPSAPTLSSPADTSTGITILPTFTLRSSDADNDYLRYEIQDQQTSTAYTGNSTLSSSTLATHNYQASALSLSTQYWWRAYAIDPGGSNTASSVSSIFSFTTTATANNVEIRGGTTIQGGTTVQ